MKKALIVVLSSALLLSGCNSAGEGAYMGSQFGYVIGSALGGITGGWRGHDVGALVGTIGGAVAGAAIGSAAEKSQERKVEERMEARRTMNRNSDYGNYNGSNYDPQGRGDDRISFSLDESPLELRNATITEAHRDGVLARGEECTVRFEIYNTSDFPVFDVRPIVEDVTGNKHVKISPNLLIESIGPRQGVRYTATILADSRLKDGEIMVMVGVAQGNRQIDSQTRQFKVPTAKKPR